jgi:hypothetical protein
MVKARENLEVGPMNDKGKLKQGIIYVKENVQPET